MEDVDKVTKVLVNLANLSELQLAEPEARQAAAAYRRKLYAFVQVGAPARATAWRWIVCIGTSCFTGVAGGSCQGQRRNSRPCFNAMLHSRASMHRA